MKLVKSICLSFILLALVSGCSQETKAPKEEVKAGEKDQEKKNKTNEKDKEKTESYEAEETYEEITFQNVNWFYGSPALQPNGGIWVYNAEKHPSEIENSFEWETEDVLLVQINDPNYKGHGLTIKGLQILDSETVKIVAAFELDEENKDKTPRRYVKIDKGTLEGKRFVIEDEKTGEAVKLD